MKATKQSIGRAVDQSNPQVRFYLLYGPDDAQSRALGQRLLRSLGASKFAVEGLSLSVVEEIEKFGIKVTVVEPGLFRTDLLAEANVKWPSKRIDDYAATEVSAKEMWSPYAGTQPGDPDKLGHVLVKLAGMASPPRLFVAGSDAIAAVTPSVEARLKATHALAELSNSTNAN